MPVASIRRTKGSSAKRCFSTQLTNFLNPAGLLLNFEEAFIFKEAGSYILFSKNIPPEILKEWEDGLRTLEKTDFFDKLTKKWSELLGVTMIYSSEKGVHAK